MGEDTRATDARSFNEDGLRASGAPARRAVGDPREARPAGKGTVGPFELDESQLTVWGRDIGACVGLPAIFALRGDLGAGKSVLARAIAQGAGVTSHMPSPTFNLLFQYRSPRAVVSHLDLYRLIDPGEVWELGWRELGQDDEIVLIEWPERAEELLPEPRWDIRLMQSPRGPLFRSIALQRVGEAPDIPFPDA